MLKFSSLFEDEGGAAPSSAGSSSTPSSNVSSDMATTGLQQKVTHDDLAKKKISKKLFTGLQTRK